jgi:NADH dehydrogenase
MLYSWLISSFACLFLDSLHQARSFHRLLLNTFLRKEFEQDEQRGNIRIAIVGAGATGVELAAELRHASKQMAFYGMHNIDPSKVEINVIEASDRVLPALPERISKAAGRQLEAINVKVLTGHLVEEVGETGLILKDKGVLESDIKVWAAGIKAPEFLSELEGLETNRINQLKVTQTLQTTQDDAIFAIGDCAEYIQPNGRPTPPRAQVAHQQAAALYKTLVARLEGKEPTPFVYRDYGSLISFSTHYTIGNLMGNLLGKSMFIEGRVARLFYISLYRMHQVAIHGLTRTGLIWLNDRILKAVHPKIKLH